MKKRAKLSFILRCRRLLWYFIVTILVLAAISMTLARSLISNVGGLRNNLETIASQYLQQPLKIETFDAKIIGFTPTFIFKNVSLLERTTDKVMVRFKEARVGLALFNSIKKLEFTPKSFVIRGINLVVTQNENNTFKVQGIDVAEFDPTKNISSDESNELSNWLFQQDKLKLENSTIHWLNSKTNKVLKFSNINLQFNNSDDRHTLSGDWQLQSKIAKRFKIELDMTGDILNPASWEGAAYVKGEEVNISEFGIPTNIIPLKPASGIYNFEVWADFKLGQLKEISGATNVRQLKFNSSELNREINIDKMGAVWRWDNLTDGWALNIDRFHYEVNNKVWPLSRVLVESHHNIQSDSVIDIYIDKLNFDDASEFVQKIKIIPQESIKQLETIAPRGQMFDTHVRFNVATIFSDDFLFQTNFLNITTNADAYIPGVKNLTGAVYTTNTHGSMVIDSQNSSIHFSQLFRDKIDFENIAGRLNWSKAADEWYITGDNIDISNSDIKLNSNVQLIFPTTDDSPLIDLQITFENGNIANAGKYYPVAIMDEGLIDWLDSSLKSGFVKQGGVVLQGRLNEFPYLKHNGKFEVSLESNDFVLQFLDGWPKIYNADADISFTGSGFDINISKAKMLNSNVKDASIYIKNFIEPELVIKGNIDTSTNDLFKYLANSPIAGKNKAIIDEFKFTGDSEMNIFVSIPLSDEMEEIQSTYYNGTIVTSNSGISLYNNILNIKNISGKINFDEKGFKANNINSLIFNEPASIRIYSQSKNNAFSQHILVQGKFHSDTIQKQINIPWMKKSTGVSNWQGIFNFGYTVNNQDIPASIVITTDLKGINLNLPEPLKKLKKEKLALSIESKFISDNQNNINFSIGDKLSISSIINIENGQYSLASANVSFDTTKKIKLQDKTISIQGNIHDIDYNLWTNFINELEYSKFKDSNNFISADTKIIFDVDSLYIKGAKKDLASDSGKAVQITDDEIEFSSLDPRTLPEFSGEIRNIFYDKVKVGSLHFNFEHSKNGLNIKKLNLYSENFDVTSTGLWHIFPNKQKNRSLTKFTNVKFISSNLGATLSSLGFQSVINKGTSDSDMTIWWHDSPFKFSLDKLFAEIRVNAFDGEILDIDPKAGRLLGLLSLSNLPRRLFGDFSDIFSSGLSFDSVQGDIRIVKGVMSAEDILMTSSPAEIHIYGKSDLVKREFDQKIRVIPNITDTTAVLGGLLGGLPTLIVTKILGGIIDLNKVEMRTYHVTGSWEKPVITNITKPIVVDDSDEDFDNEDDNFDDS